MARILVVEDELELQTLIRDELERSAHTVIVAADGPSAVSAASEHQPDLIVLDLMLPGYDGLEAMRRIRAQSAIPILVLTAKSTELDRVVGLEVGADDYLTKPFSMRELKARVSAILRRVELIQSRSEHRTESDRLEFTDLIVDVSGHTVESHGEGISLTATEFTLLRILASNQGRVFSREFLLEEAWGDDVAVFDRTVDSHIQRLRKKLGGAGSPGDYIETVWGVGYRFNARKRP